MNRSLVIRSLLSFLLLIFILFTINQYISKENEKFDFLLTIDFKLILVIFFLSFLYLLIEGYNQKKIINIFSKKNENFFKCFLIINTAYLFNTIFNFFGTFFRCVYLKKIYKIDIRDFVSFSLLLAILELLIFSGITLLINIKFKILFFNDYLFYLTLSIFITFLSSILFLLNFKKLKKLKIFTFLFKSNLNFISRIIEQFNNHIFFFIKLFVLQYFVLLMIYLVGFYELREVLNFGFSSLATAITSLSFFLNFTPLSIGITETMIYIGTKSIEIKISEIIFLAGVFRLSLLIIYFIFGMLSIFLLQKKN